MEIVIGTYENFLVGYQIQVKDKKTLELKQSFTDDAHCGSVRAICASKKYIASGSVDETIHLVNMRHRIDAGAFNLHNGTITALQFYGSKHLFSGSEDNNIAVFSIPDRKCEKILRGHSGPVTALALHSTGKMLLSVSKDKTLRTWNLVKGRCAYVLNLKEVANKVHWSPCQSNFAAVFDTHVDIYDITNGSIVKTINKSVFDKRIENILYLNDQYVLIYGDSSSFLIVDISGDEPKVVSTTEAHTTRVKGVELVAADVLPEEFLGANKKQTTHWLVSASNDGFIKVWSLNLDKTPSPTMVTSLNTTCRPTCLTLWTEKESELKKTFEMPELKITEEELEQCKAKIREKKKRKAPEGEGEVQEAGEEAVVGGDGEDDDNEPKRYPKQNLNKRFKGKKGKKGNQKSNKKR